MKTRFETAIRMTLLIVVGCCSLVLSACTERDSSFHIDLSVVEMLFNETMLEAVVVLQNDSDVDINFLNELNVELWLEEGYRKNGEWVSFYVRRGRCEGGITCYDLPGIITLRAKSSKTVSITVSPVHISNNPEGNENIWEEEPGYVRIADLIGRSFVSITKISIPIASASNEDFTPLAMRPQLVLTDVRTAVLEHCKQSGSSSKVMFRWKDEKE